MNMNQSLILVGTLGFVMLASTAIAKPAGGQGLHPARIDRMAEKLKIDDTTVTKIKTIVYAAKAKAIDKKASLQKARLDLQRLLDAPNPDRAAVMNAVDAIGRQETAMRKHRIGMLLDVAALLTPEQRKGFKRLMQRRNKKFRKGRRGPGGRGFGGPKGM